MTDSAVTRKPFHPVPVILTGQHVRLEPLGVEHHAGLLAAGKFAELWLTTVQRPLNSDDAVAAYLDAAACSIADGSEVPYAIIDMRSNMLVGSTRWMDIARAHGRLEIGGTWITPSHQRTVVNTEAKYLQLSHLFDRLGALRVQLKTDLRNLPSQRAMERIGAVREGVLRRHMIVQDGYVRDSVYYGITDQDWLRVKPLLVANLAAKR